MKKKQLESPLRFRIALDIAQGMAHLHSFKPPFVHRDLKSPNVLICSSSERAPIVAKVSDFGTAMRLYIGAFKEKKT